ncbi:MAG: phage tail tube protein [Terriglobia bacterium]
MFEPQRAFDVTWLFSTKKETAYGTALADADLNRRVVAPAVEVAKIAKDYRSDLDRFGKGHEFATELEEVSRDLRRSTSFDASSLTLAWVAAFALGKVTTTQPNPAGNPTAYDHKFTFADPATSKQAPTTTVYEELTADLQRRLLSLACSEFTLAGRARDVASLTANWVGSGQTVDGALTPLPALTAQSFLLGGDADILFGPQGAPVSLKERVLEWSLSVSQNLQSELGYHPGSGKFRGRIWYGPRRVSAALTFFAQETDDLLTLFLNDTVRELQIDLAGDTIGPGPEKHRALLRLPAVILTAVDDTLEGNQIVYRVEIGEQGVLKQTGLEPLEITVTNTETSFLT